MSAGFLPIGLTLDQLIAEMKRICDLTGMMMGGPDAKNEDGTVASYTLFQATKDLKLHATDWRVIIVASLEN